MSLNSFLAYSKLLLKFSAKSIPEHHRRNDMPWPYIRRGSINNSITRREELKKRQERTCNCGRKRNLFEENIFGRSAGRLHSRLEE